jgi:hypothetical protein
MRRANTSSWLGAQLKHRENFNFTFLQLSRIHQLVAYTDVNLLRENTNNMKIV